MNCILLFLVAITTAPVSNAQCTGSMSSGVYEVLWAVSGGNVDFTVSADTTGWVGVGFSLTPSMPDSDIVVGATNGMLSFVEDRWASGRFLPSFDTQQNLENTEINIQDGRTTMSFRRALVTTDNNNQDLNLNQCVRLLRAWGGSVFSYNSPASFGNHGTNNRGVFPTQLCLQDCVDSMTTDITSSLSSLATTSIIQATTSEVSSVASSQSSATSDETITSTQTTMSSVPASAAVSTSSLSTSATTSESPQPPVTEPLDSSCVEITDISLCLGVSWNNTSFPNLRGHITQDEANAEISNFLPLVSTECSNVLVDFLCSVYAPFCSYISDETFITLKPCREVCTHVRSRCEPFLLNNGFQWSEHLECDKFPSNASINSGNIDDLCLNLAILEPSTATTSTVVITTDSMTTDILTSVSFVSSITFFFTTVIMSSSTSSSSSTTSTSTSTSSSTILSTTNKLPTTSSSSSTTSTSTSTSTSSTILSTTNKLPTTSSEATTSSSSMHLVTSLSATLSSSVGSLPVRSTTSKVDLSIPIKTTTSSITRPTTIPDVVTDNAIIATLSGFTKETFSSDVELKFKQTTVDAINTYCSRFPEECVVARTVRKRQDDWTPLTTDDIVILEVRNSPDGGIDVTFYVKSESASDTTQVLPYDVVEASVQEAIDSGKYSDAGFDGITTAPLIEETTDGENSSGGITVIFIAIIIIAVVVIFTIVILIIMGILMFMKRKSKKLQNVIKEIHHEETKKEPIN